MISYIYLNFNR